MYASYMCGDYAGTGPHFRGGTLTEHLASQEPVNMTLYFRWVGEPGYQHTYTRVYGYDGQLLDTVPTGWINASGSAVVSSDTFPVHGVAEYLEQPTLTVDIEVEDNVVPAAVAGHYEFPKPDGCAGARKNYTYAIDNPDPEPDTPTELIAVSLNRNDGFVLKSWTGNCAYFDANGNYLGMLPVSVPDDPDDWISDDTIYVKCLEANPTQMASAMTGMAVLAGAIAEGAIPPAAFTAVSAQVQAQVEFAPYLDVVRENGTIWSFTESQDDQDLLARAGFQSAVDDIGRWVKAVAAPGALFKLIITDPPVFTLSELGLSWLHHSEGDHIDRFQVGHSIGFGHDKLSVGDICYLETKNSYISEGAPIGVHRISVRGSSQVLMTVVVDYGWVKEAPLTVIAHTLLNWSANDAQDALKNATNEVFLKDRYPRDGSLRARYEDDKDRNCRIALVLNGFGHFTDTAVKPNAEQGRYLFIDDEDEWNEIHENWTDTQMVVIEQCRWHVDAGPAGLNGFYSFVTAPRWYPNSQMYISAASPDLHRTIAHEFGHYWGGLGDLVGCEGCGGTYNTCECVCPNALSRYQCTCGYDFPDVRTLPEFTNNLMGYNIDNEGLKQWQIITLMTDPD